MAIAEFIGIPYRDHGTDGDGLSCWELVELYMRRELNIKPPHYKYAGPIKKAGPVFMNHLDSWEKIENSNRQAGDLVMLRVAGQPIHCGVLISTDCFLHTLNYCNSNIDRLSGVQWRKRILGFWRWRDE